MKKETKNFVADICSLVEEKKVILCLKVFDKKMHGYIYQEKISFDITQKADEFAATIDKCLLGSAGYSVDGVLKESRFHTSMWVDCKMVDLSSNQVVAKQKMPYSFKELYMRFKGQPETEWENEISAIVYNS